MYKYDQYDQAMVDIRVAEFRDQTRRRIEGHLSEDQFKRFCAQVSSLVATSPGLRRFLTQSGVIGNIGENNAFQQFVAKMLADSEAQLRFP